MGTVSIMENCKNDDWRNMKNELWTNAVIDVDCQIRLRLLSDGRFIIFTCLRIESVREETSIFSSTDEKIC